MKRTLLLFALLVATTFSAVADKGMWLPSLISSRIKDTYASAHGITKSNLSPSLSGVISFSKRSRAVPKP
ncbi:MAG: hypothetical protein II214_00820, partial [Alistipes sp.]|nr:hypothetical protein [Alistipes sp.]